METYLRDFYKTLLNIIYVKPGKSLSSRFEKEAKNDFLNWGKTFSIFKKDFNIPMDTFITKDEKKLLHEYSEVRNVIIHNNGLADEKIINNYSNKYQLGESIEITNADIFGYINISNKLIIELEKYYNIEFTTEMRDIFVNQMDEILLSNSFYFKTPKHHGYAFIHKKSDQFKIEYIKQRIIYAFIIR